MSQEIVVVGLNLAKNVFQVHAIDAQGQPVVCRQLRRAEVLKFFAKYRLASSAWKPVPLRIIGAERSAHLAIRCD
jgi:transposase